MSAPHSKRRGKDSTHPTTQNFPTLHGSGAVSYYGVDTLINSRKGKKRHNFDFLKFRKAFDRPVQPLGLAQSALKVETLKNL